MSLTCKGLIAKYQSAWDAATRHLFLDNCKTGVIQPAQFNTWLVQDYLFVVEFTRMSARQLSAAPVAHFDALLAGMSALKDELNWFRDKAAERKLNLGTAMQDTCKRYCEFMEKLSLEPYAVQATAFWAIELAYNQGWQLPGKMQKPYDEFAERWGNPGFTEYVNLLEKQADEVLQHARKEICDRAEQVFLEVAAFEQQFWDMAFAGK
jgi:thiaminase/transcriptional activator TenA